MLPAEAAVFNLLGGKSDAATQGATRAALLGVHWQSDRGEHRAQTNRRGGIVMAEPLSKRDRLARVVQGLPVDRLPLSLWRHFYVEETAAESLAEALCRWHRRFDFDFVKINVRAQYHTEGWGCRYGYSGQEHVKPETLDLAVTKPSDYAALERLDVHRWPFSEMLALVHLLRSELGPDEVLLMTVFNPMSVALDLAGGPEALATAINTAPAAVHRALRAITDTFCDFVQLCVDQGADGLYFATTYAATAEHFTREQYEEFGRPYDLEVLEEVRDAPMNMLHVCKSASYVRELADYPVQAINWDTSDATNPTLADLRFACEDRALVGGLSRQLFDQAGAATRLVEELARAREMMGDWPFVVGSTCTLPTETLEENIDAVVAAVRQG
jgi:uroporphyrinogen decarboxylase